MTNQYNPDKILLDTLDMLNQPEKQIGQLLLKRNRLEQRLTLLVSNTQYMSDIQILAFNIESVFHRIGKYDKSMTIGQWRKAESTAQCYLNEIRRLSKSLGFTPLAQKRANK